MSHVYIVHGYQATADDHWFQWLKRSLTLEGYEVEVLSLPNSSQPDLNEWLDYMEVHIKHFNNETIFIGHSLGCITILQFIQRHQKQVYGAYLVSGFCEKLPDLKDLDGFVEPKLDYDELKRLIPQIKGLTAKDDNVVPWTFTETLCKKLDAPYLLLDKGGHFLGRDGYTTFLALKKDLVLSII
ncbi:RBBP9/YdeN family alpha/beta hydrolase [Staphylococcus massiliensis]|uniref:Serine hydrolase family protein n=1 Tax=Staphylococcus massiliensis S46 TaxID=1229783 RepID=K9AKF8_9STAP|nr:alpha/beta fold hydrolase [Staphylococcus massiliensis]EKU46566.1 hypothetical protein C273_08946 [Staphylococcus massiliensis S46]MCG3399669.1 alpha/beta hydrolase [Staphylococcus massiliensis]MCG3400773.1 alpha/beta hydrolase [Staphylococcus massiliensis]MCG3412062.1 alpha/beta hydrolase [Staphylococcus massiliensis]PNZ99055.1 serine hydrolase family protein [Staphylococcus massiliensis CCUG 55927]